MKKVLLTVALLFTSLFIFSGEVHAEQEKVCHYDYQGDMGGIIGKLRIEVDIYYDSTDNKFMVRGQAIPSDGLASGWGIFDKYWGLYDSGVDISETADKELKSGICPNAFFEQVAHWNFKLTGTVCFESVYGGSYCNGYNIGMNPETDYFSRARDQLARSASLWDRLTDVDCNSITDTEKLKSVLITDLLSFIQPKADVYPIGFIEGLYDTTINSYMPSIFKNGYVNLKNRCIANVNTMKSSGLLTPAQAQKRIDMYNQLTLAELQVALDYDTYINILIKKEEYKGALYCGFLGEKTFGYVKMIYSIIKFLIPAVIILLGMTDFLKVLFSGEDKDMKQAWTSFVKRIIAGIIFILLPILIEFIFKLVGFSENCIQHLIS